MSAVRTAAWGLVVFAVTRVIGVFFASASMASAVGQAVAAEYGAGRLGVTWSDPHAPMPSAARIARRAFTGAAVGAAAAVVLTVFTAVTGAILVEKVAGNTPVSLIVVGLVSSALTAMRDELLLHGVTLRAMASADASPIARALACGLTSGAAALGEPGATARVALTHACLGVILGALWVRDRGAWMAWGAHTAWLLVTGTILGGGLAQMRVAATAWGGGDAGWLGGSAAVVALAPLAVIALALLRRAEPLNSHGSPAVG